MEQLGIAILLQTGYQLLPSPDRESFYYHAMVMGSQKLDFLEGCIYQALEVKGS